VNVYGSGIGAVIITPKAMFGLVVCGGMEWNGKVNNKIPLFGCAKS
jgi:hypothetical protein